MRCSAQLAHSLILICSAVASLRFVSPGAVTDNVTTFFPQKVTTFLVIVTTRTSPVSS